MQIRVTIASDHGLKLFDRYVLKEILPPFFLGLLGYTFVMMMNQILLLSEMLIARGVVLRAVLVLLFYLIPAILAFTVPMSVLMGILAGLSRMSSDSEITACKTLGISNLRLLRPVLLFAGGGLIVTSFLVLFLAPRANHRWTQTMSQTLLTNARFAIRPGVFDETIPNTVIFIQDTTPEKMWKNLFVHIVSPGSDPKILYAREGRLNVYSVEKRATLELFQGAAHAISDGDPEKYSVTAFDNHEIELDVGHMYASLSETKGAREKDIRELYRTLPVLEQELAAFSEEERASSVFYAAKQRAYRRHRIEIHKKYALPFACVIFALLGIALGASTRKGGRASGFTVSIAIIVVYYTLITAGENLAKNGHLSPWVGMWGANILLGLASLFLFIRAYRESAWFSSALRVLRIRPRIRRGKRPLWRFRRLSLRFPNILDRYIMRKFLAIFVLSFLSILAIFVVITFFEQIDSIYEHDKPLSLLFQFIWFKIPDFMQYILPVSALVAALLSLGLLAKFNEITAMKACGISLYRIIVPVIFLAFLVSAASFYLQDKLLPSTNRKAEIIWNIVNDQPPQSSIRADRRWVMSQARDRIYHYGYYDPKTSGFSRLTVLDLQPETWEIRRRLFAEKGYLHERKLSLIDGWTLEFAGNLPSNFQRYKESELPLSEDRSYFSKEWREPDQMGFSELRGYIGQIADLGYDTVRFRVDLHHKISFPLAGMIMVILGLPFAFSMGKRGTLIGIGTSLVIAMIYWAAIGVFRNLGYVDYLHPFLAAWGPNLIFGLLGGFLIFTLRT